MPVSLHGAILRGLRAEGCSILGSALAKIFRKEAALTMNGSILSRSGFSFQLALLGAFALLLTLFGYQSAYFGDELFPFFVAKTSASFSEVFFRINEYKPRFVFNGIWTLLTWWQAPRYVAACLNFIGMWSAASLVYILGRRYLDASMPMAMTAAACVLISRFGMVLYHDYLSGIIGTWGLALFLVTTVHLCRLVTGPRISVAGCLGYIALGAVTIFVYETYVAGLLVLGLAGITLALFDRTRTARERRLLAITGLLIWALPLFMFVLATQWFSTFSVMTGTAGQTVAVGAGTVRTFLNFSANVLLGTNYGLEWFTGYFNAAAREGRLVGYGFATVLAVLWTLVLVRSRGEWQRRSLFISAIFMAMIAATIAISSLPGPQKADGRWMFPVSAFVALFVLSIPASFVRNLLLVSLLGVSAFHLSVRSYEGIYNVKASQSAARLAEAMYAAVPLGKRGLVLGITDGDMEWILGGNALQGNDVTSGDVYCWINLRTLPCLDPRSALNRASLENYDFALAYADGVRAPTRLYAVPRSALPLLVQPTVAMANDSHVLGGTEQGWNNWSWQGAPPSPGADVEISGNRVGTFRMAVSEMEGRVIAYEAYSGTAPGRASMRLQVNWLDGKSALVDAQIKVVTPEQAPRLFTMLLDPPPGSVFADVYVTAHDSSAGAFSVPYVGIVRP